MLPRKSASSWIAWRRSGSCFILIRYTSIDVTGEIHATGRDGHCFGSSVHLRWMPLNWQPPCFVSGHPTCMFTIPKAWINGKRFVDWEWVRSGWLIPDHASYCRSTRQPAIQHQDMQHHRKKGLCIPVTGIGLWIPGYSPNGPSYDESISCFLTVMVISIRGAIRGFDVSALTHVPMCVEHRTFCVIENEASPYAGG